jgi:hypothetical protein
MTGRHHYVFLAACGCPIGLTEATRGRIRDEGDAWQSMYRTRREERAARERGVTVVHVDHDTYVRDHYQGMLSGCPHTAEVA